MPSDLRADDIIVIYVHEKTNHEKILEWIKYPSFVPEIGEKIFVDGKGNKKFEVTSIMSYPHGYQVYVRE